MRLFPRCCRTGLYSRLGVVTTSTLGFRLPSTACPTCLHASSRTHVRHMAAPVIRLQACVAWPPSLVIHRAASHQACVTPVHPALRSACVTLVLVSVLCAPCDTQSVSGHRVQRDHYSVCCWNTSQAFPNGDAESPHNNNSCCPRLCEECRYSGEGLTPEYENPCAQ